MNKNKKRLSRLLIPMLASTAINVNAMEEESDFSPDYNSDFIKSIEEFADYKEQEHPEPTEQHEKIINDDYDIYSNTNSNPSNLYSDPDYNNFDLTTTGDVPKTTNVNNVTTIFESIDQKNSEKKRNVSTERYSYQTTSFKEHDQVAEQINRIVVFNPRLAKKGHQAVVQYKGTALDKLKSQGYCLVGSIPKTTKNYDLCSSRVDAAGNTGSVAKYKKGNQYYAVKFEPNPKKTGLETFNNNTYHNGDNKNEDQFYEDAETLFINCPWLTRRYAKFEDEYGTYTVTDWVSGKTITKWAKELKEKDLPTKLDEIKKKGYQILNIVNDFYKNNKMNTDLHGDNLMVNETGTVVVVDHGKYRDMKNIKGKPDEIAIETLMRAMLPLFKALNLEDEPDTHKTAYFFHLLQIFIKDLNCEIAFGEKLIIGKDPSSDDESSYKSRSHPSWSLTTKKIKDMVLYVVNRKD